ncbi:peptidoglycan DD-metalloendopeptidase family protein [Bacillus sp. CGMCC 1.16607]|uniref:peptidoglycan DD-metalloendopeptidase family protein n=1 Tax=Bacillus sp. CGMCC 1.16607 TaxID=3351842 RepID=UPI00363AEB0A
MQSRADEIRKRIARRKKSREQSTMKIDKPLFWAEDEEKYGFEKISSYEAGPDEGGHPLFNKERFMFKILASVCLFLLVAILFKNESSSFQNIRNVVKNTMETDFQFAAVSKWYEDKFGQPLALLPFKENKEDTTELVGPQYALPASGRIIEGFAENGQGIIIEAGKDASVEALNEGFVLNIGIKEGFGKTVIIQHADKTETWYGNLATIDVKLYDFIKKGTKLGVATSTSDGTKSSFNLAMKKGKDFIDPSQVIRFE